MVSALISAHQRGVDVTLIVPRKVDSKLVRYASRSHYEELLEEGVRIMQFDGGLLHSKAVAIDNELSVIGSVNLDMRSMRLNFEVSALVYDRRFAEELRALLGAYIRRSEQLSLDAWRRRAVSDRFLEGCCRLLGPML
jgi:cardiolipin synthase